MISIIIPAFNEEGSLPKLISHIRSCDKIETAELIVIDGGSTDKTVESAKNSGASVYKSPKKGRASQMNYGAQKAKGEILYFLHADTFPPKEFINDIEESLSKGINSGCYRLSFDDDHFLLKLYSWFTRFDIDYFRFGDQSLFVTKELFNEVNGFDEKLIVMEDQMIVKKLTSLTKFEVLKKNVITSSRKYKLVGVVKLQLIFSIILVLFYLGVSQELLVRFYKKSIN